MSAFRVVCAWVVVAVSVNSFCEAHPGRTDSKGGHYNRKTGEYHFHNSGAARAARVAPTRRPSVPARAASSVRSRPRESPANSSRTPPTTIPLSQPPPSYTLLEVKVELTDQKAPDLEELKALAIRIGSLKTVFYQEIDGGMEKVATASRSSSGGYEVARSVRLWTTADSRYRVRATLISVADDKVRIKREEDGKIGTVPIERLSVPDKEYVKRNTDGSHSTIP